MLSSVVKSATNQSLEIRQYGSKEDPYLLYNDDGISYDFERGEYTLTELKSTKNKEGQLKGNSKELKNNKYTYGNITWRWMTALD